MHVHCIKVPVSSPDINALNKEFLYNHTLFYFEISLNLAMMSDYVSQLAIIQLVLLVGAKSASF